MKKEFAFFDVDKTILKGDSMFDLLFFGWKTHPISILPSLFNIFIAIIKYFFSGMKDIRLVKNGIFYIVKFLNENEIETFVNDVLVKKRVFQDALVSIERLKEKEIIIILVSASPYLYLKYFKNILDVEKVIGTEIDEDGKIIGENCKHIEKVRRINSWLKESNYTIDYESSYGFSDSLSADQPMLELVKMRFLINSDKVVDGYKNLSWK